MAAKYLEKDFYVDNMLSGTETIKRAKILIEEMASNNLSLLHGIAEGARESGLL